MYTAAETATLNCRAAIAYAALAAKTDPHASERAELQALIGAGAHVDALYPLDLREHLRRMAELLKDPALQEEVRGVLQGRRFETALEALPEEVHVRAVNEFLVAVDLAPRPKWLLEIDERLMHQWAHLLVFLQLASGAGNLHADPTSAANPLAEMRELLEARWRFLTAWIGEAETTALHLAEVLPPITKTSPC